MEPGQRLVKARAIAVLLGLVLHGGALAQVPQFEPAACALPDLNADERPRVRCGTVSVPRDHHHPDAGRYKLAVVVVRSAAQPAQPDPVLYISGGPGGPLTRYTAFQMRHPYAVGRDLILVDQRGMGHSEPALCPALQARLLAAQLAVAADPAARETRRAAFAACREGATADGVDLATFGTAVTAEDLDQVRQALRIEHWNVVGESYGTTVAMALLGAHPEPIRSAVLDSLYPPDALMPLWSVRAAAARNAFFTFCAQDAACQAIAPDLAGLYRSTLDRLGRAPIALGLASAAPRLTASLFEILIDHLVYYPTAYPNLPRLIAATAEGDPQPITAALASVLTAAQESSLAAYAAVQCRDRAIYRSPVAAGSAPLDETGLYGVCAEWTVPGPAPTVPAGTLTPVLVLAGQFDPNLDPADSRHVASLIGEHARWLEFSGIGHNVRHFSACAEGLVAAFIEDPVAPLDSACASRALPIRFLPRRPP